ncbi:MAG: hypothetical protein A2Y12_03545 [Planctomycetes bacterium GWF2_42_9]|nr:MAG: hypothetical protein A2Y12_03545 [Planctomycetes bacterium GWF2_42_9]
MKNKNRREKIEIIGGISLMVAAVLGWAWFIWMLGGNGLTVWQKLLSILVSYVLIAGYLWLGDRGFGAVPVRIIHIERKDP